MSAETTVTPSLLVETQDDLPMVWLQIAIAGGAAGDPQDIEGFTHHLATLCRRGAGSRDRMALDRALDELGASLEIWAERDAIALSGMCLRRNLDALIDLVADVLSAPHLTQDEHDKLLRETRMGLDEVRDDDSQLAARFFNRYCVPGHVYARSVMGTERSLERIELAAVRAALGAAMRPENLIIGFAGDIDAHTAEQCRARLVARLPSRLSAMADRDRSGDVGELYDPWAAAAPGSLDDMDMDMDMDMPRGRRILVVDKPERTQSQIAIGHLAPRYGHPDMAAFTLVETIFGGMFTSRLMQEIRVKRGWSYGAGCHLYHSRRPHWFRIHLAPAAEVTADALALTLSMFEDLVEHGVTQQELGFAKRYLTGNLPFRKATARLRLRLHVQEQSFGLERDYADKLLARIEAVTLEQANEAARRWLRPADALCVIVATADSMVTSLERFADAELHVVAHDSY